MQRSLPETASTAFKLVLATPIGSDSIEEADDNVDRELDVRFPTESKTFWGRFRNEVTRLC
jgi:hypothetical protein